MSNQYHDIYTGSDTFSIVVNHYGNARGTKSQFVDSDPSKIDPLINENIAAYHFATETLGPQLAKIRANLNACWEGSSATNALGILTQLDNNATTIGTNTKACGDSFTTFQNSWVETKSEASGLYEGVAGTGANEDNAGAHRVYSKFNTAMQVSMHSMPSHLRYGEPLDMAHAGGGGGGGAGSPGGPGGAGPGGYGPGGGNTTLVNYHSGVIGPGGPGGPGPGGTYGPGGGGLGNYNPGPHHYAGGNSGFGPGTTGTAATGVDTSSQLAGYTGGGMGPGPGPGGAVGPGPGGVTAGLGSSTAGLGGVGAAGAGIAGIGAAESNAARRPMTPPRGGAGNDDEDERDRTTWLSEEEGIWDGETDAPPGVIA